MSSPTQNQLTIYFVLGQQEGDKTVESTIQKSYRFDTRSLNFEQIQEVGGELWNIKKFKMLYRAGRYSSNARLILTPENIQTLSDEYYEITIVLVPEINEDDVKMSLVYGSCCLPFKKWFWFCCFGDVKIPNKKDELKILTEPDDEWSTSDGVN